ncbi:hypothetical protein LCGC14_2681390, partial [marine sediment metagenome]
QGNYLPGIDALRGISSRIAKDDNYWDMLANGAGFATLYRGETIYKTAIDNKTDYFVYLVDHKGNALKRTSKDLVMLCEMINEILDECK